MNNNTLDGVKMLHHDEMRNYDRIQGKIISVIMNHGCKIIETPSFEDYDVYQHFFPQLRQQMVKTIDTDGRVLVLRPDVTLPIVETAAREFPRSNQLLKFGYVSTVFREYYGRSTYGKDFLQGGIEILGDSSPECDGEVIVTAAEILKAVGVENIRIDIGTAAYTQALFDGLPLSEEQKATLKGYMAERNLVACKSYIASLPISSDARKALEALPVLFGPYAQTLSKARDYSINSGMLNALSRLERVYDYILYAGYADKVQLDFGFASRLGYYTDTVFKVYVDGALYDIIDGGRYDQLSSRFGVDRPACGFGMNINLLYEYMSDAGLLEDTEPSFQMAVSYTQGDQTLVRDLMNWRDRGFRVAAYPDSSFIDSADYSIHAIYRNGSYYKDGKAMTAEELEALMRRL
ncbi:MULTISPECIES: ATP phosphoribosyltransferase regulatory subunit [Megasphaera]|uniref:ATP phosphoribosyltransferase regulatory subunit n=1 Tax=Megasphaera TaxID=906 RepID=UPI00242E89B8|nr:MULTISPECIES: ATP phosphoribosyltransferase regulatory subunit [Megasphaera]MCI6750488.1 ATP phosphoribosyltransferase regulatory subunit [Megasphaera elsdenii]MCI7666927.1 ATP phosphoribosyltransferase regulatory subunit [Megasphaera elsdenii]MDY4264608.1 ATP phosphoribosyltransferase regulatory subunit [Megasphaera elsdenii]MDY5382109.1 ATP phosphoribosyltransferase regulatory subunit [Megasphaera elsdenii]